MLRVGVVGCGYWGPNLIRNFYKQPNVNLVAVADKDPQRLGFVVANYPTVKTYDDASFLTTDPEIDAIVIATPVATHFPLALAALEAGKHVFVEKPLAPTVAECDVLIEEASRRKLTLYTDHVFVHTGAVRRIKEIIDAGDLGDLYYFDSTRINLGLFQSDVNVMWDLAVHDLSILNHLTPQRPVAVSAVAYRHMPGCQENMAVINLFYDGPLTAHINVNWLSPVKVRKTLIGGSKKMIVYDDIEPSQKVMVYEKGVDAQNPSADSTDIRISYRTGDVWGPRIDQKEALDRSAAHFADCVLNGKTPVTDGHNGREVVRILEAAMASAANDGRRVELTARRGKIRGAGTAARKAG